jgi:hypothetical protein
MKTLKSPLQLESINHYGTVWNYIDSMMMQRTTEPIVSFPRHQNKNNRCSKRRRPVGKLMTSLPERPSRLG